MARIPDISTIQRRIPTGRAAIATIDPSGAGVVAGELSKVAFEFAERRTKNQLAKADVDMSTALIAESNSYDDDPDYQTITERFTGNTEKRLGEIAATIDNAESRNAFVQNYRTKVATQTERMNDLARGKEREFERGDLIERSDKLLNAGIVSGNIGETYDQYSELVDSSVELGWLDADEAAKSRINFKHRLAKGRIERLAPEKRVEALKQPWAKKNLPADDYSTLLRKAEADTRKGKAQDIVDGLMGKDVTREDGMAEIDKKYSKKPELREEAERRFDYAMAERQRGIVEIRSEINDKYKDDIVTGKIKVDDIPEDEQEAAGGDLMTSFRIAEGNRANPKKIDPNIPLEDRLNSLKAEGRFVELRDLYVKNWASLSVGQNMKWSPISIDGVMPVEIESLFAATASLDAKIPLYTKERKAALKDKLNDWYQEFQKREKRIPSDKEVDDKTDRMIMIPDPAWYKRDVPLFMMPEKKKAELIGEIRKDDPDIANTVDEYFKLRNITPDMGQYIQAHRKLEEMRDAAK